MAKKRIKSKRTGRMVTISGAALDAYNKGRRRSTKRRRNVSKRRRNTTARRSNPAKLVTRKTAPKGRKKGQGPYYVLTEKGYVHSSHRTLAGARREREKYGKGKVVKYEAPKKATKKRKKNPTKRRRVARRRSTKRRRRSTKRRRNVSKRRRRPTRRRRFSTLKRRLGRR